MKNLLNSKIVLITGILISIAAISGATNAYFTSGNVLSTTATLRRLSVKVTQVDPPDDSDNHFDLSDNYELSFVIDNSHEEENEEQFSSGLVKADFTNGTVDIWSDDEGNEIDSPETCPIDKSLITAELEVYSVVDDETDMISLWFIDTDTGLYYNLIGCGMTSTVNVTINFTGGDISNSIYHGAVFHFDNDLRATQVTEKAALSIFGIDLSDLNMLDFIDIDGNIMSVGDNSVDSVGRGYEFYQEVLRNALN